jgi:hypothetical protein
MRKERKEGREVGRKEGREEEEEREEERRKERRERSQKEGRKGVREREKEGRRVHVNYLNIKTGNQMSFMEMPHPMGHSGLWFGERSRPGLAGAMEFSDSPTFTF